MNESPDSRWTSLLLRMLLDGDALSVPSGSMDWHAVLRLARSHGVLLRAVARFRQLGVEPPALIQETAAREQQRIDALRELIRRVADHCAAQQEPHVFLTRLEGIPDAGRDVDLLVLGPAPSVTSAWLRELGAQRVAPDLTDRIAGATRYATDGGELDIHHGRLGIAGEDAAFAPMLIARRRLLTVSGTVLFAPAPTDYVVLQGMRRMYARRGIRLTDVLATVRAIRAEGFDWTETVVTAERFGVLAALSCYLGYVERTHRDAMEQPLLSPDVAQRLLGGYWGRVGLRSGRARFPIPRVIGGLLLRKLVDRVAAGSWDAAGRLCLIPVLGAAAAVRSARKA